MARVLPCVFLVAYLSCFLLAGELTHTTALSVAPKAQLFSTDEGPVSESASKLDAELEEKAIQEAKEAQEDEADDIPTDRNAPPTNGDPTDQPDVQLNAVDIDGFPTPEVPLPVELDAEKLQEDEFNREEEADNTVPNILVGPAQTPEPVAIPVTSLLAPAPGTVTTASPQEGVEAKEEPPAATGVPSAPSSPARRRAFFRSRGTRTITVNVRHFFPNGVPIVVVRPQRRSFLLRRF
ncbi:rhoptry protein ROP12 [Toxoplasma gondii TgCatPRC2]|uniref:Rhoptry protein ROP12 n=5 Tax=Toxoplasma gondii TaxID=5811 RepID=S7UUD9_TOXGG|nr:rhoptry protein ROP12 [Toxoplasma gondii GT1]KAF4642776.1 rhoptry protein ROP12 [Toxoplasma gondii]KFG39486.1 rhoptry protein ROP12 [Toxoplasma gondii FOU]KYK66418.1 rhoptry protein ROP12 [Toxoplasma gondii TgCatPRC2]PIL99558.1 rhoptry protein ROP12 [Toxoplasma gondii COUG]